MEFAPFWTSAVGLAIGAGMGLWGLVNPRWSAGVVRLQEIPGKPGGFAEFRGAYGGLFLATHLFGLFWIWRASIFLPAEQDRLGFLEVLHLGVAVGVSYCCGLIWLGTAIGRFIAIFADRAGAKYNWASVLFELCLGGLIAAPTHLIRIGI